MAAAGLALPLAAAPAPQEPDRTASARAGASVAGVVRSSEAGARPPLPFALVEIRGSAGAVLADARGRYLLRGVAPGLHRLRASHPGFAPVELEVGVPEDGVVQVDLVLEPRPMEIPGLRVRTGSPLRIPTPDSADVRDGHTRTLLGVRTLEASTGLVEAGVAQAVGSAPGGRPPGDPRDVLLMRGSASRSNLVLLDGAPVYTPFHTGGLLPSFELGALASATHHVGGAPARYDGGVAYILDLRTRPGRASSPAGWASVDLLSARGGVEAGVDGATVLAVGRTLHDAAGSLAGGSASPYGYGDLLLRGDVELGPRTRAALTTFVNRESVFLDVPSTSTFPGLDRASWGNRAASARLLHDAGPWSLEVGTAASRYDARLPFRRPGEAGDTGGQLEVASGTTDRLRLTADAHLPAVLGGLRIGTAWDRTAVEYGSRSVGSLASSLRGSGTVVGAYADGGHRLAPELVVRWGARLDHFAPGGIRPALRGALLWTLREDAVLSLAGGRYHQLLRNTEPSVAVAEGDPLELGVGIPGEPTHPGAPGAPLLTVATADHLTLALDQALDPSLRLRIEGFAKRFHPVSGRPPTLSSGVDLRVHRRGEDLAAWLGYALAWAWETRARAGDDADFSGRHLLSAGLEGRVAGPVGVDLRVSLSDGLPVTAVPLASADPTDAETGDAPREPLTLGTPPDPADGFLRVDAELFAEWTPSWGGRAMRLRPYLRLLNALDRRDALFYYFEPWRDEGFRPLAELSVLPVVGLEWRF